MLLIEAALPVASRYGVTVCCSGNCTVTFGGGGAMKVFFSPHAASSVSTAAPAMPVSPTWKLCSPAAPAGLIGSMSPGRARATTVAPATEYLQFLDEICAQVTTCRYFHASQ